MSDTKFNSEFKTFFQKGLASDIFMSQGHYFIYRTLGENALAVNQIKSTDERMKLIYLGETSMSMSLVTLSRIFDKKNRDKKFKVRCLETLIEECHGLPGRLPLKLAYHPDLKRLSSLANVVISETVDTRDHLVSFYYAVLNSESVQKAVQNLKKVRDKYIVHNEHTSNIEGLTTFWDDYAFLQDIAKLYLSTVGKIYLGTNYAPLQEIGPNKVDFNIIHQFGWIIDLLEKVLGEDKVNIWWEEKK